MFCYLVLTKGRRFRWVACQLDHLEQCDSDQQCRDALKSLPPTLDETYERILDRVPKSKQRLTDLALNCIAYASPKLNLHQLREILSVPAPSILMSAGAIIREESITRYCSSMIRKSTDGLYLEFSHFSAQEFLEKGSAQREWSLKTPGVCSVGDPVSQVSPAPEFLSDEHRGGN